MVRRRVVVLLALLALCLSPVFAQNARQMRSEVEASMLVTGTVDIERDGAVAGYALDQEDKLPAEAVNLVRRFVPQMQFEPVLDGGAPIATRAKMSLRLVAAPVGEGQMRITIRSAHFVNEASADATRTVRSSNLQHPSYPTEVASMGGKGTVYTLVQVAPDGSVRDVAIEQVNLTVLGSAREMASIRESLAKSVRRTARRWQFTPPSDGSAPERGYWLVRVPVEFSFYGDRERYGQWSAYHPGPRNSPAWALPDPPGFSPDTLVAGTAHPAESRFRLLTPLEG